MPKDKKTSATSAAVDDKTVGEEQEKALYLTQIRHLENQLERYRNKCTALLQQQKELTAKYTALKDDKKDISEYLKHAEMDNEVDELKERLADLQQASNQERDDLKRQLSQLKEELQDRIDKLTSENEALVAKLADHKDCHETNRRMMSNVETLETKVASQKTEHEDALYRLQVERNLETANLTEQIQRLEANAVDLVEFEKKEKARHHELLELHQMLFDENKDLEAKELKLRLFNDILNAQLSDNISENLISQKEVKRLKEELQQLKALSSAHQSFRQDALSQMEALSRELTSAREALCQTTCETDQLKTGLQQEKDRTVHLESALVDAAVVLRQILKEEPRSPWKVQRVLSIVLSSAFQGTDSALNDSTEESVKMQTANAAPNRVGTLNLSTDPLLVLARYRPGDLGFVPQPTLTHTKTLSRSGSSGLLSKSQSTSCTADPSAPHGPGPRDSAAGASNSTNC